jgi:hypothetical protein
MASTTGRPRKRLVTKSPAVVIAECTERLEAAPGDVSSYMQRAHAYMMHADPHTQEGLSLVAKAAEDYSKVTLCACVCLCDASVC